MKKNVQIRTLLATLGQPHLAQGIDALSLQEQSAFLNELERFGASTLAWQRALLAQSPKNFEECTPHHCVAKWGDLRDQMTGEALLIEGKVGCLLLAGGQGSRMGCTGPKGMTVVVKNKTLFHLFAEKAIAAEKKIGRSLPVAIMTSPLNDRATRAFFEENQYFGIENLSFFSQEVLPLLDREGNWFLQKPGTLCVGPDGNGGALECFFEQKLWHQWKEQGVTHVNVCFVDNPLADPFDPTFVGFAHNRGLDCALKGVERLSAEEKMGVFASHRGRLKVLEYFEYAAKEAFSLAHTGLMCVKMSWIASLYEDKQSKMPFHLAHKQVDTSYGKRAVLKCERFLFDLLESTPRAEVMLYPRERTYAPLKGGQA